MAMLPCDFNAVGRVANAILWDDVAKLVLFTHYVFIAGGIAVATISAWGWLYITSRYFLSLNMVSGRPHPDLIRMSKSLNVLSRAVLYRTWLRPQIAWEPLQKKSQPKERQVPSRS